nr:hypothetical protein SOV_4c04990 [Sporomusa ovata DSM 2662]
MYPLLVCSFMVVAIAIERYLYYRQAATDHNKLLPELTTRLNSNDLGRGTEIVRQCRWCYRQDVVAWIR